MRCTVLLIRCLKLSCIFVLADDAEGDVGTAGVDLARFGAGFGAALGALRVERAAFAPSANASQRMSEFPPLRGEDEMINTFRLMRWFLS